MKWFPLAALLYLPSLCQGSLLVNSSFEDQADTVEQAEGWIFQGVRRQLNWGPLSGAAVIAYPHWETGDQPAAEFSQEITGLEARANYEFTVQVYVDKPEFGNTASGIELKLESRVNGEWIEVRTREYDTAEFLEESPHWSSIGVAGACPSDNLRVSVIVHPFAGLRGGAIKFDDAELRKIEKLPDEEPPASPRASPPSSQGRTMMQSGIPYVSVSHPRKTFDLYLPANGDGKPLPLVVWIHGGGWYMGDRKWINVPYLTEHGYAIASIGYRFSGEAPFPAQIQDCNAALNFLVANADKYGLDVQRLVVGGASAGGHLALLLGLAREEKEFGADPAIRPRAVLDFCGPSDLISIFKETGTGKSHADIDSMVTRLLGSTSLDRPDLARAASPVTYIRPGNCPVMVLHGDKDDLVPIRQSQSVHSKLKQAGVKNELVVVKGGGHGGPFETPELQKKVLSFLGEALAQH